MPADLPQRWTLLAFAERFAAWVDLETVDEHLGRVVADWIDTRRVNPRQGARRETRVPGLWWAQIPGSQHKGGDYMVVCSYWIDESDHSVRCDNFGSVAWPL